MKIHLMAVFCMLLLCSCLTLDQSVTLTKGGAFAMHYVYTYKTSQEPTMKAVLAELKSVDWNFMDENRVRNYAKSKRLEVYSYNRETRGDETIITVDLSTLNFKQALDNKAFPGLTYVEGDRSTLTWEPPAWELPKDVQAQLHRLCPEFRLRLAISVPGKIVRTNGKIRSDTNTVDWEYTFGQPRITPMVTWE